MVVVVVDGEVVVESVVVAAGVAFVLDGELVEETCWQRLVRRASEATIEGGAGR